MYLSVDGGASKTHILVLDDNLNLIEELKTGSFNFSVISPDNAIAQFEDVLKDIDLTQIKKTIFGLAGMDTLEEKLEAQEIFANHFSFPIRVINDAEMALSAGTNYADSIVIIAGTGSHCFGHNQHGITAKTSGLGWILADEGSGFNIGWDILHAAVRSFDGRGEKTCLQDLVLDHFDIDHIYDLKNKIYGEEFSKDKIAALSKLLDIGIRNNDQVSNLILEKNIGQLLISLRPVINRLELQNQYFELVLAGSLFTKNVIPYQNFSVNISREYPQAKIILLDKAPAYGGIEYLKVDKITP